MMRCGSKWRRIYSSSLSGSLAFFGVACGGSSSPTTPTPTPTNHAPVISAVVATPSFGIQSLQSFAFTATATDADGDALTYTWSIGGATTTGPSTNGTFSTGGDGVASVTVTDGKGGSVSSSVSYVVGTMAGTWTVTEGPLIGATFVLQQSNTGTVTGTVALPGIGTGSTIADDPGRITSAAALTMRVVIAPFSDFTMTGTMASTGRRVTGTLQGSGFIGEPFVLSK